MSHKQILKKYRVAANTTGGVTNKIFTGNVKTSMVCKLIQQETGAAAPEPGCADAAAFTFWPDPDMQAYDVYNAEGTKNPSAPWRKVKAVVHTTLPEHAGPVPTGLHGADITRFFSRLAVHERGHGSTGEQLVASSAAFLDALPPNIPPKEVKDTNAAVRKTLAAYVSLARWSDRVFDEVTIHGTTSGSIANDTPTPDIAPGLGF